MPSREELEDRFYGAPVKQLDTVRSLQDVYWSAADAVNNSAPDGRELSLALTKLEESFMWATRAMEVSE